MFFFNYCHFKANFKDIPEFVKQNEVLKKAWIEKWDQLVTNSFELSEVIT